MVVYPVNIVKNKRLPLVIVLQKLPMWSVPKNSNAVLISNEYLPGNSKMEHNWRDSKNFPYSQVKQVVHFRNIYLCMTA